MENKLVYKINEKHVKVKLKEYLRKEAELSGRFIKSAAMEGRLCVNGKKARLNFVLSLGDVISLKIEKEETQDIEPEKMDIEVIYEDEYVIVVNKKAGIVVHPAKCYQSGTLANGLLYYFKEKGENCIVRLVSRLDMDTTGLILIAKSQFSHMALSRDMSKESFKKGYYAIIHGNLEKKEGTVDAPIYRDCIDGLNAIKRTVDERGQRSITHYEVIESHPQGDLIKLMLETGRTHQIRVHMNHIGHPLFGDPLYGIEEEDKYITRQALHAYKLEFPHPKSGEIIKLQIGIPEDMKMVMEKIKKA